MIFPESFLLVLIVEKCIGYKKIKCAKELVMVNLTVDTDQLAFQRQVHILASAGILPQ